MSEHPDVLILGGGVIGLTTAYYLTRAGVRVAIVDKGELGQESSWAGAGILSAAPTPEMATQPCDLLAAYGNQLHPQIAAHLRETTGIDTGYRANGGWELFEPGDEPPLDLWRKQQIAHEVVDVARLRELEPSLRAHERRAIFMPGMAQVRNSRHVKGLMAHCGREGVAFRTGCPVLGFEKSGGRITAVRTALGRLTAGSFLVATGAWSEGLLADVGWSPGIHPVRGQIALLQTTPPVLHRIVEAGKRYLVPRPDGRVLVGSTEEQAGFEKRTTATAIASLLEFAIDLVPALATANLERTWAGLRPGSPDGLPFLGKVPGCDNLFVAAGHYRAGIHHSPATGLAMTALMLGEKQPFSLEAFRLDRGGRSSPRSGNAGVPVQ